MFLSSLPGFDKKVVRYKHPVVLDFYHGTTTVYSN